MRAFRTAISVLALAGCTSLACPEPRAVLVYVQRADGTPVDDATLICNVGADEVVPLGDGEYGCGTEPGEYSIQVIAGADGYWADGLVVGPPWGRCPGPRTLQVAIVFPDP